MDYEKLHKDTIAKLQEMVNSGKITVKTACGICADFVPESEDEKIRKEIIYHIQYCDDTIDEVAEKRMIAWLEKQGEQKPQGKTALEAIKEEKIDNQNCVKPIDKVEPKFKVGDSIKTTNEAPLTITKITDSGYWSEDLFICSFGNADKWELVEQNPAWSEEDERNLQGIIDEIQANKNNAPDYDLENYDRFLKWLKSLKDRYTWKPSEGQLECLGYAIEKAEKDWSPLTNNRIYLTLKALKEQLEKLQYYD